MPQFANSLSHARHIATCIEDLASAKHADLDASDPTTLANLATARLRLEYGLAHESIPDPDEPVDLSATADYDIPEGISVGDLPSGLLLGDGHCVWYTHDGEGAEPDVHDRLGILVALTAGALTTIQIATETAAAIDADPYFDATSTGGKLEVTGASWIGPDGG